MGLEPGSIQQLALIIILLCVNAFFAAAEMAIVSVNKNKINALVDKGDKQAIALSKILEDPNKFLSTIQVGITLAGFLSSALAASKLASPLTKTLIEIGIPSATSSGIAIFTITLILSYFTLVFGELIPKRIALRNSEAISLKSIGIISFVSKITAPFVKILSLSTNFFMRILKINTKEIEEEVTEEEINSLLEIGEKSGLINKTGKEMIDSIFLFDNKLAKDVMTSRKNAFFIDIDKPITEYYDELFELMHSRIPVYRDDFDNVIGILHMKDIMRKSYEVGFENIVVEDLMQEAYLTSERKNIDVLFEELQRNKKHIAILIDEYGVVSGIVTIEDLIEEIVGEIEDEFDDYDDIVKLDDKSALVKGYVTIGDLNEAFDLDLDEESEDYDTVAGLIIYVLGDLPENTNQDSAVYENLTFEIVELEDNRIELVKLTIEK